MKPIYQTAGQLGSVGASQVVNSPGGVPAGTAVTVSNVPAPVPSPDMPDPFNVWLAPYPPADGLELGTYSAPFDASTREKFDARMATFGENVTINLKPGTYFTRGFPRYSSIYTHWVVRDGWKILGYSQESTIIKLVVDAEAVNAVIHEQTSPGVYRTFDSAHFAILSTHWSLPGDVKNVEIANLTLDANHNQELYYDGTWMRYASSCFVVSGNQLYSVVNSSIHDVTVKNFGNNTPGTENFVAGLGNARDSRIYRVQCIEPVCSGNDEFSTGGTSILGVFNYNNTNCVIEDCVIDGFIPGHPELTGWAFVGMTISGTQCVARRNVVRNLSIAGPYHDTGAVLDTQAYENYYWNVRVGLFHSLWTSGGSTQRKTTFENNQVYIMKPLGYPHGAVGVVVTDYSTVAPVRPSDEVIIRNNFFGRSENVDQTKHRAIHVSHTKNVTIRDNVVADWGYLDDYPIQVPNCDTVDYANNRRENGESIPLLR